MKTLKHNLFMTVAALSAAAVAFAQETGVRSSSSIYLPVWKKATVTLPFQLSAEGKRFQPTWGLDQAWISEQNLNKGINHMGKENIGIGRTAYRYSQALTNDSVMGAADISVLRQRSNIFNKLDPKLPLVFTADQEAVNPETNQAPPEYFVKNKQANNEHWAAMINSNVHWMQANTQHPIVGISPFNEPDYWTAEEGATVAKQWQIAKLLKEKYPRCKDIAMVGGNTLNDDKALEWYSSGKQYYDWGNTHQLAGSFANYAGFFQQLQKDGKVGYADEMHNTAEAMVGLEYGMTVGIWWGFDSRARGEFCQFSSHGVRLAYAEHRNNWTAASVYRHDDGRVKAFIGSSERQAYTTNYQLLSTERDVYYDGYGPVREYFVEMPGGTGYQKGQTNAECVIDVTWGEDVAPSPVNGTYKIVNKVTGNALAFTASSSGTPSITQQIYKGTNTQQWVVKPVDNRVGGDYSFYEIASVSNAKTHINVLNFSTSPNASLIAYSQNATPTSNEQWYLEYYADGYYYIRNRESALYLASRGTSTTSAVGVTQLAMQTGASHDRLLWRFLPVDVTFEKVAPAKPESLTAEARQAAVYLSWTACSEDDVEGYMVLRAEKGTDDWNTIARKLTTTWFVDNTCRPGTSYIYKVKAIDLAQNQSEPSETAEARPTGERGMLAQWLFNGNLYDETPNMMDAASLSSASYATGHIDGSKALNLQAGTNYVQLPYEVAATDEMTIALWVKWTVASNWQRIFDFGNGTGHYMFLTPSNGSIMRFAIKNGGDEQLVSCTKKLDTGVWRHVAVTIARDSTTIYVDGVKAAQSTGITIRPSDFHPTLNYIGRSQFESDPFFRGHLSDLRIYNYALTAEDVASVMQGQQPAAVDAPAAAAAPSEVYTLDGRRATAAQRGVTIRRTPLANGTVKVRKVKY